MTKTSLILLLGFLAVCAAWIWLMNDCVTTGPRTQVPIEMGERR